MTYKDAILRKFYTMPECEKKRHHKTLPHYILTLHKKGKNNRYGVPYLVIMGLMRLERMTSRL